MIEENKPSFMQKIGDIFFQQTKYIRNSKIHSNIQYPYDSSRYKLYSGKKQIFLPKPNEIASKSTITLYDCIRNRRSYRKFSSKPISAEFLGYLLWLSNGLSKITPKFEYRTAPSAGALYPIETYLFINKSSDLNSGIYHWNIREHALELLQRGNFGLKLSSATLDQTMVAKSPAVIVWTAVFSRSKWKYHERAYRYIFMDVGHIAAQLALGAVSLGWGTCQIGAFYDNEVNKLLNLDGIQESVVYMTVLGKI